jgi:hypothetical protein
MHIGTHLWFRFVGQQEQWYECFPRGAGGDRSERGISQWSALDNAVKTDRNLRNIARFYPGMYTHGKDAASPLVW